MLLLSLFVFLFSLTASVYLSAFSFVYLCWLGFVVVVVVEVLIYVHGNRRLIRDGSPGRPPRLSHTF